MISTTGRRPVGRGTHGKADDAFLRNGRVDDAIAAEFFKESVEIAVDTARLGNVFAGQEGVLLFLQDLADAFGDRSHIR